MEKPPFQFGLNDLFVAMTGVAVLVAFPSAFTFVF
jgi:hypothetical protein